jgi:glutamine phosphoribosylpyrophosphate amidotransferase
VGKPKPTDETAMQITGAKMVRQIAPGDMVTQDFREERVTIETDPASGLVTRASCG